MTPLLIVLMSASARAEFASTRVPPGLFRQLPRVAGRPLSGNPSLILKQFLPEGTYRIRLENGRREFLDVRSDALTTRVGDLFLLRANSWIHQPTGGMILGSGRMIVASDGDGWSLDYELHHRGPITNPSADRESLVFLRFSLKVGANRELRGLSWDWQKVNERRRRGRVTILRTRPPPSRRCDQLSPHPHPEDILVND